MKIALLNANKTGKLIPPLGLLSLATYSIKKTSILKKSEIKIFDVNQLNYFNELLKFNPSILCISCMSFCFNEAKRIAEEIKNKKIIILVGGVHISTHIQSFCKPFDIGIIGEGEISLLEIIQHINQNHGINFSKLKDISGIIFFDKKGKVIKTRERELIKNLDEIPIPNRSFLPEEYFLPEKLNSYGLPGTAKVGHILTSRGCPFNCVFCSTKNFWRYVRLYSIKRVVEEIRYLKENYGAEIIMAWDDTFLFNKKRARELLEELKKQEILGKIKFSLQMRPDLIDEEFCQILKELGTLVVGFGFESGSNKILRYLKNNGASSVEKNKNAIILLDKQGINISGSFMFGSPNETIKDLKKTVEFMESLSEVPHVVKIWYGETTPMPSTELWGVAIKKGIINKNFNQWEKLKIHQEDSEPTGFFIANKDKKEFMKLWGRANQAVKKVEYRLYERNKKDWLKSEFGILELKNSFKKKGAKKLLWGIIKNPKKIIYFIKFIFNSIKNYYKRNRYLKNRLSKK